jgi:hypothetical protein
MDAMLITSMEMHISEAMALFDIIKPSILVIKSIRNVYRTTITGLGGRKKTGGGGRELRNGHENLQNTLNKRCFEVN